MPFAIVTLPRSGSYHLADLLNSATDIACFGEIFKGSSVELPEMFLAELRIGKADVTARDLLGMKVLNTVRGRVEKNGEIFGFKDFIFNLRRAQIWGQLSNSKNWKKIFLIRNPVERYVSMRRASDTGIFVVKSGQSHDDAILNKKITFVEDDFTKFIKTHNRLVDVSRHMLDRHGSSRVLIANYEMLSDIDYLQYILSFVGSKCDAKSLTSTHIKQYTMPISDGVSNWSEFIHFLNSQHLGHFIEKTR